MTTPVDLREKEKALTISNRYIIEQKIGNGKFGFIYRGKNIKTGEPVAIKLEPKCSQFRVLKYETTVLNYLSHKKCKCVPPVYWYGCFRNNICLVIPYYNGGSLHEFTCFDNGVLNDIMVQMIHIMEDIHTVGVIHRDIKPHNFMFHGSQIYIIDFGMSVFESNLTDKYFTGCNSENIMGTPNYISYFIHEGWEPCKRDDLISLGYIFLYLQMKTLPWFSIPPENIISSNLAKTNIQHPNNQYVRRKKEWVVLEKWVLSKSAGAGAGAGSNEHKICKFLDYCYKMNSTTKPYYYGIYSCFLGGG